jgi:hypothetical protein
MSKRAGRTGAKEAVRREKVQYRVNLIRRNGVKNKEAVRNSARNKGAGRTT